MAFCELNPRYHDFLVGQGLVTADDYLNLPAVVIGGHPNRHVGQVTIGSGREALRAFLKREHCVPWKDRLANAWGGFGLCAKSSREAILLESVHAAGIECPEWLAVGEDGHGRAFLLVREIVGRLELRLFLRDCLPAGSWERRRFARSLGEYLARLHDAGFDHADLYAKHVLVDPTTRATSILDWQRSCFWRFVPWPCRWRDLAALDATLADDLATPRERLACLIAYLQATLSIRVPRPVLASALRHVRRNTERLRQRRRIRELAQVPLPAGTQNLIWLDGEALCVTREFQEAVQGRVPGCLRLADAPAFPKRHAARTRVSFPGVGQAILVHRRSSRPLAWLWSLLRRRTPRSPELEQAGMLFRLQRHGIRTPRLLAVGQRHTPPWRTESFLLTEPLPETRSVMNWLEDQPRSTSAAHSLRQRRHVIRETAAVLRRMHDAGCYLDYGLSAGGDAEDEGALLVQCRHDEEPTVVVGDAARIRRRHKASRTAALHDILALRGRISGGVLTAADELRFILSYLGLERLTPAAKQLVRCSLLSLHR